MFGGQATQPQFMMVPVCPGNQFVPQAAAPSNPEGNHYLQPVYIPGNSNQAGHLMNNVGNQSAQPIYVMQQGQIVESGSPAELNVPGTVFSEVMQP